MHAQLLQSYLSLRDPVDHSPRGSSVHGILQARILEWVATPSSWGSSRPRDRTHISSISHVSRQVLYHECHLRSLLLWLVDPISKLSHIPRYRGLGLQHMNIVEDTTQVISQSVTYCQGIHASIASNPWDPFQLYFLYKPAFERIKKLGKDRSFFFCGGGTVVWIWFYPMGRRKYRS